MKPLKGASARRWRFALLAILSAIAIGASANENLGFAEHERCSRSVAIKTTVREIATTAKYMGRCVSVHGVMRRSRLFHDVGGVYLQARTIFDPSSNGAQLGLDNLDKHFTDEYRHVAIVGRVQDCEEVRACVQASSGPDEIVMISGYCHTANGAYIWVEEMRRRPGHPFERQMGSAARPGYGDLVPAPSDWGQRATVEAFADDFLNAVRTEDGNQLAALHFRNVGLEWEDEEAELLRFILRDRRSPFRELRSGESPQREILVARTSLESKDERDQNNYHATVCFCREADCTGRWPIATFDADNLRTRPYVCTHVAPYHVSGKGSIPHFTTELGKAGLAEPRGKR